MSFSSLFSFKKKVCFLIIILLFLFGYICGFSNEKLQNYEKQNAIISAEFYGGLEMLFTLNEINSMNINHFNLIRETSQKNCLILETYDFALLCSINEPIIYDGMEEAIKMFFFNLDKELQAADFNNLSFSQKEYFKKVGNDIDYSLYYNDSLTMLYKRIQSLE